IVVARTDGSIAVLRGTDGQVEREFDKVSQPVRVLACSPDGSRLLSGGATEKTAGSGQQANERSGRGQMSTAVVEQKYEGQAWEWDVRTGKLLQAKDHLNVPGRVMSLAFAPDGT